MENPVVLRRWLLSRPELTRILNQFEVSYLHDRDPENPNNFQNHEQGLSTQKTFQKQANNLCEPITRMGNSFLENFPEILTLDTCNCVKLRSHQAVNSDNIQLKNSLA